MIDNQLVLKKSKNIRNMGKTTREKISVKSSAAKPLGKPLTGYKTLGIDPEIRFYAIEEGDDT